MLLTSLAEGADRLFARAALAENIRLRVILPDRETAFVQDFSSDASQQEFSNILKRAETIEEMALPALPNEKTGHEQVTDTLISRCELLIAVWNGAMGRGAGGTADTIEQALQAGRPVIWINSNYANKATVLVPPSGMPDRYSQLMSLYPPSWLATSGISGR